MATGFSNAISRAPQSTPAFTRSWRIVGGVQKQKMSGASSRARAPGSAPVRGLPYFAASARREASGSAIPTTSNRGLAWNAAAWWAPLFPMPGDDHSVSLCHYACALSHSMVFAMT